jgi:hypothetical protein
LGVSQTTGGAQLAPVRAPFGLCFGGGSHASPASGVAMYHSQLQKPVGCYRTLSGSFEKIKVKRT